MKKIKVAHIVSRLECGGVESVIYNLCSKMDKNIYESHVITQDINDLNNIKQFEDAEFIIHYVPHKKNGLFRHFQAVNRIIKIEKFDIIHAHTNLTNFIPLYSAWLCSIKVRISHVHSAVKKSNVISNIIDKILVEINKLFATDYFACGNEAAICLFGRNIVKKGKVNIVNNAINVDNFAYSREIRNRIRNCFGLKNENFCIGHVGRFVEVKNHKFIINMFEKIYEKFPDARLLLVGGGEMYDEISEYIKLKHLEKAVICTGNVSNANEMYQAMDLFVLPSFYEGLPVSVVEAQCAGLPCIVSDKVDKSVAFSNNITFLPIDNVSIWFEKVEEYLMKNLNNLENNRISGKKTIIDANYSIDKEQEKLEKFYYQKLMNKGA